MESETLGSAILGKMYNVSKWQRYFIIHLISLFRSIKDGRPLLSNQFQTDVSLRLF